MPKLTNEQIRFLIWLSLPETHFELGRDLRCNYRKPYGLKSYVNKHGKPYKYDSRTLFKLVNENLVTSEIVSHYDIKYEHYFLTEAGQVYVHMLAISK